MDPVLRLHPGQSVLTPAQDVEARRFADERIQAQLSTEPVDEQEAEAFLCQAYVARELPPPQKIYWLDSPVQLAALVADGFSWEVWDDIPLSVKDSIDGEVLDCARATLRKRTVKMTLSSWIDNRIQAEERLRASLAWSLWDQGAVQCPGQGVGRHRGAEIQRGNQRLHERGGECILLPGIQHEIWSLRL